MEMKSRLNVMIDGQMSLRNVSWRISSNCIQNEFYFNPEIFLIEGIEGVYDYEQLCKFLTYSEEGFSLTIASIAVDTQRRLINASYAVNARIIEERHLMAVATPEYDCEA